VPDVAEEVRTLARAYEALGCRLEYPFMMVSFLALAVIPDLRVTNRGLVDGREFRFVDPVLDQQ
jgi:adenine deaminase